MSEGFLLSPWMGMIFFRYCRLYKLDDPSKRVVVLRRIVARKKGRYLPYAEEFMKGRNVLDLRTPPDEST